jgi:hypothetical protein
MDLPISWLELQEMHKPAILEMSAELFPTRPNQPPLDLFPGRRLSNTPVLPNPRDDSSRRASCAPRKRPVVWLVCSAQRPKLVEPHRIR